jgi:predicted HTH transcriptional regulator
LDFRVASELFAKYKEITPEALRSLHITTKHQGRVVPTIGGLLLFGKARLDWFPDAWVRAGRFAGIDRSRLVDSVEIRSYLPQAAEEAIAFVQKHLQREAVIGAVRRQDRWTVPPVAIREAVINAIVHADYAQRGAPIRIAIFDNRIEVDNPGLLPFGLTVEDIRRGVSKLRNRVIGRVFHELHLIEQWGSGIQRMTSACVDAGLAPPELEEVGTHFRVTIGKVRVEKARTDARDRAILAELSKTESLSTAAIARRIKLSPRATHTRLRSLTERGLVVEIGTGPHDPRRRYALSQMH